MESTSELCGAPPMDDDPWTLQFYAEDAAQHPPLRLAESARTAVKPARKYAADLLPLDVETTGLNGVEIFSAFKADAALANVPMIFSIVNQSVELEAEALELGAADVVAPVPAVHWARVRAPLPRAVRRINKDTLSAAMPDCGSLDSATSTDPRLPVESALSVAIIEDAEDAIISKSLDGTVIAWNSGASRIFGYSAAEMLGGSITRLLPADRLQEESELIAQLASGKTISHFVTQRLRKNGSPIDVSVTLSPVRDASGKIVAISKIARDITEAYQQQLTSGLFAAIIEHSDDAIISNTLDGTITSWNFGAQRIFGYSATEMIGGPINRLFPDDLLQEESELIGQVALGKMVDHFVTRRLRKDGMSIDVSVTLSPICEPGGQIIGVSKIARDITASRQRHTEHDSMTAVTPGLAMHQPVPPPQRAYAGGKELSARANRACSEQIDQYERNSHN